MVAVDDLSQASSGMHFTHIKNFGFENPLHSSNTNFAAHSVICWRIWVVEFGATIVVIVVQI